MALMEQICRQLTMSQHCGPSHHPPQLLTHYESIMLCSIKWLPQPVTQLKCPSWNQLIPPHVCHRLTPQLYKSIPPPQVRDSVISLFWLYVYPSIYIYIPPPHMYSVVAHIVFHCTARVVFCFCTCITYHMYPSAFHSCVCFSLYVYPSATRLYAASVWPFQKEF